MPLQNGQYLEVVCPLDLPVTEQTPWRSSVSNYVTEGDGWFTWFFSIDELYKFDARLGRKAVVGHRMNPVGPELYWKMIGVLGTLEVKQFPFFIDWKSLDLHPQLEKQF